MQSGYDDVQAAELYDILNPWAPSDAFMLGHVMQATAVIDIGCGTGRLLHRARAEGHRGRLVGIDPDPGMLGVARRDATSDVTWRTGPAAAVDDVAAFDLAVMASNTFQYLATDDDLARSLQAIATSLLPGGRFVFDTRNPAVREWETWTPDNAFVVVDPAGRPLRMRYDVESVEESTRTVTFTESTCDPDGTVLRCDRATFRFLDRDGLEEHLTRAGFVIESIAGDYDGAALDDASVEIVVVARKRDRIRIGPGDRVADRAA